MVQPNNYILDVENPADAMRRGIASGMGEQAALQGISQARAQETRAAELQPFAVKQAGLNNEATAAGIQATQQNMDVQRQELAAQQAAGRAQAERKQQFEATMGNLASLGKKATSADYTIAALRFPEFGAALNETWQTLDAEAQDDQLLAGGQAFVALQNGKPEIAVNIVEQRLAASKAAGDEAGAATAEAMLQLMKASPEAALASFGMMLTTVGGSDFADTVIGGNDPIRSTVNLPGGITKIVRDTGVSVVNSQNEVLTGEAAQAAILEAEAREADLALETSRARSTGANLGDIATGGEAAAVKAEGGVIGASTGEAKVQLGGALTKAQQTLDLISEIRNDPALPSITGMVQGRMTPLSQSGTDLNAKIDQLKGKVFLDAFQALKGAGAVTETEGGKAQEALGRLNRAQSAEAYQAALDDLESAINDLLTVAQGRAGTTTAPAPTSSRSYLNLGGN